MYKRRDVAIVELVANSWDAGATQVHITIPKEEEYDQTTSRIIIKDNGVGMTPQEVEDEYLVVGRNRREDGEDRVQEVENGESDNQEQPIERPVMGRKGIGKLAGFGIASKMVVTTWRDGESTTFTLDSKKLKIKDGKTQDVEIPGKVGGLPTDANFPTGTSIVLEGLKHKTRLEIDALREALGRRFTRLVRGRMKIFVNEQEVGEPNLDLEQRTPDDETANGGYNEVNLSDGNKIRYWYGFSKKVLKSSGLRGFTIYVRGKTAQASPFFFFVEGTASGQHGTRYMTGAIEADYLDKGTDDESDLISTDRQEIDWENEGVEPLRAWGDRVTRDALSAWAKRKGEQMKELVLGDDNLRARIERLDTTSQKQAIKILEMLGSAEAAPERALELASALVSAYEYRHFHDVVQEIETASEDPEQLQLLLSHLATWKVLESRAILEIVKGRLEIIDKFHSMIVNDSPETASKKSKDNMHDLIAGYPWLLNPEWQVLSEEKRLSTQLKAWSASEIPDEAHRLRYDFLALTDERRLIIVEIKRAGHALELEELQRLERYKVYLSRANNREITMVIVYGGSTELDERALEPWKSRTDLELLTWNQIYERARNYYEHYKDVLEGDTAGDNFSRREREVARTREVLERGNVHRDKQQRRAGLGIQDVDYSEAASGSVTVETDIDDALQESSLTVVTLPNSSSPDKSLEAASQVDGAIVDNPVVKPERQSFIEPGVKSPKASRRKQKPKRRF